MMIILLLVLIPFVLVVKGLFHNNNVPIITTTSSFSFSQQPPRNVRRPVPRQPPPPPPQFQPHGWMIRNGIVITTTTTTTTTTTLCFATAPTQQYAEVVVLVHDDDDHAPLSSAAIDSHGSNSNTTTTTTTTSSSSSGIHIHPDTVTTIARLVTQRSNARHAQNYTLADDCKEQLDQIPIRFCRRIDNNNNNNNNDIGDTTIHPILEEDWWGGTAPATTDLHQYPVITTGTATTTTMSSEEEDAHHHHHESPPHPTNRPMGPVTFRVAITDISRKQGGGSTWSLICHIPIVTTTTVPSSATTSNQSAHEYEHDMDPHMNTVLSYAHRVLGMAVTKADRTIPSSAKVPSSATTTSNQSPHYHEQHDDDDVDPHMNTVLSYAHRVLGMAVTKADRTIPSSAKVHIDTDMHATIQKAKEQLLDWYTIHEQLHPQHHHSHNHINVNRRTDDEYSGSSPSFASTTASISLNQLWDLIHHHDHDNDDRPHNALFHWYLVETRLSGRTAADAAFWFAVSGIVDDTLYDLLMHVVTKELLRFGIRSSCRYKDVVDIVTRCAAAGIRHVQQPLLLESIVHQCLQSKVVTKKDVPLQSPYFNLHSNECSILIWHFSTRQRKQRTFLQTASKHYYSKVVNRSNRSYSSTDDDDDDRSPTAHDHDNVHDHENTDRAQPRWYDKFADPTRPLIIDIGCGMGISLLGLASISTSAPHHEFPYHLCNFIGVDLSSLSINYANGIARRWNINDRLLFVVDEAEHFLDELLTMSYPGPIQRILIQFPTPYRLSAILNDANPDTDPQFKDDDDDDGDDDNDFDDGVYDTIKVDNMVTPSIDKQVGSGNTQLPHSIRNGGFMVTSELLQKVSKLLLVSQQEQHDSESATATMIPYHPDFIFQSNCEDVAVLMRNMACKEAGFIINTEWMEAGGSDDDELDDDIPQTLNTLQPTQRTLNWIASYNSMRQESDLERASGYGWWTRPILPKNGCTETEVACTMKHIPVHRCILRPDVNANR